MKKSKYLVLLVVLYTLICSMNVFADNSSFPSANDLMNKLSERIISFHSDIKVNTDSSMIVTETITVNGLGDQIKRGIYRDFPTTYHDNLGNKYTVKFNVTQVLRDGESEPYRIESIKNGKRMYIGNSNFYLSNGQYTYTITYYTNRQLGFFEDHDELYWNVTGNDWAFTIDKASAKITLPSGITKDNIKLEGYTGIKGSRDKNYKSWIDENNNINFSTTTSLSENEGLTIVAGWPKGIVHEPSSKEKLIYFLTDNLKYIISLIAVVIVLVYYILSWLFIGIDPKKGTIIPLYEPPDDLSPASVRYLNKMKFDKKTLTAAILNMAVKGYLKIEKDSDFDVYKLTKDNITANLSSEEIAIAIALLSSSSTIRLAEHEHNKIQKALKNVEKDLKRNYETKYFFTNNKYFIIGCILSIISIIGSILASVFYERDFERIFQLIFSSFWLTIWSVGVYALTREVIRSWKSALSKESTSVVSNLFGTIFTTVFALPFWGGEIGGIVLLISSGGASFVLTILSLIIINICFYYLLKAPTLQGREIMDKIEGFKLFLGVAEKERLNYMFPVDKTPELFEKFLPYALALDVEQEWSEQFAEVFANMSNSQENYTPSWYYSSTDGYTGINDFTSSFSDSFTSAIATSSTPPPSSGSGFSDGGGFSGGGGGGSSGGGGGGGGGGGW